MFFLSNSVINLYLGQALPIYTTQNHIPAVSQSTSLDHAGEHAAVHNGKEPHADSKLCKKGCTSSKALSIIDAVPCCARHASRAKLGHPKSAGCTHA